MISGNNCLKITLTFEIDTFSVHELSNYGPIVGWEILNFCKVYHQHYPFFFFFLETETQYLIFHEIVLAFAITGKRVYCNFFKALIML